LLFGLFPMHSLWSLHAHHKCSLGYSLLIWTWKIMVWCGIGAAKSHWLNDWIGTLSLDYWEIVARNLLPAICLIFGLKEHRWGGSVLLFLFASSLSCVLYVYSIEVGIFLCPNYRRKCLTHWSCIICYLIEVAISFPMSKLLLEMLDVLMC